MMNFKKVIEQRRKEATKQTPGPKDPSVMSLEELDREEERLEKELRSSREEWVRAAREDRTAMSTPRRLFLPKKRRAPWE